MTVLTSTGTGPIRAASRTNLYYQTSERVSPAQEVHTVNHYDSFTLSAAPTGESRFQMDLVSRLSREIRTATTTGDVQALRNQVSSGTYQVDASAIAARMLHLAEG